MIDLTRTVRIAAALAFAAYSTALCCCAKAGQPAAEPPTSSHPTCCDHSSPPVTPAPDDDSRPCGCDGQHVRAVMPDGQLPPATDSLPDHVASATPFNEWADATAAADATVHLAPCPVLPTTLFRLHCALLI